MAVAVDSLSRRFEALRPHLNERQRRLWLGAEGRELGPGGAGVAPAAGGEPAATVGRGGGGVGGGRSGRGHRSAGSRRARRSGACAGGLLAEGRWRSQTRRSP